MLYLAITVAFTVPIIITAWFEVGNVSRMMMQETQANLVRIACALDQSMIRSLDEILTAHQSSAGMSAAEKRQIIHKELQPIVR